MKLFNIYLKKSDSQTIEDLVVIKDGFSFPAFWFSIFWFLQHRMWKECFGLVLVNAVLIFALNKGWFGSLDMLTIELGLLLIAGLNANYWYEQHLMTQKYQFVGCVFGENKDEAKLRFISNCFKDEEQGKIFSPSIGDFKKAKANQYQDLKQYFTT